MCVSDLVNAEQFVSCSHVCGSCMFVNAGCMVCVDVGSHVDYASAATTSSAISSPSFEPTT
jgi:hypothetical protein